MRDADKFAFVTGAFSMYPPGNVNSVRGNAKRYIPCTQPLLRILPKQRRLPTLSWPIREYLFAQFRREQPRKNRAIFLCGINGTKAAEDSCRPK